MNEKFYLKIFRLFIDVGMYRHFLQQTGRK